MGMISFIEQKKANESPDEKVDSLKEKVAKKKEKKKKGIDTDTNIDIDSNTDVDNEENSESSGE